MPSVNLSVLNQRQTPALYADTLANIPAAGYLGRIFWSTDTFAIYRDNGTGWDLFGGPGTGTVTGTGTTGQIAIWNGSTVIGGTGTTGTGSVVLSNSPALISPSFNSVNVIGGIAAMPTGSGTLVYTSALANYVDLTTNQTIAGLKIFSNFLTVNAGLSSFGTVGTPLYTEATSGIALNAVATNGNGEIIVNNSTTKPTSTIQNLGTYRIVEFKNNSTTGSWIANNGAFVLNGGTSSQLLAADGSTVATSSFAPATGGTYLPLAGGNLTGVVNSTTRLNLGGATDNSSYALNVTGNSIVSGSTNGTSSAWSGNMVTQISTNSGSGSTYPLTIIKNTLATQGDGSSTFNFAGLEISSGAGAVDMYLSTSYAAGTWEPAGLLTVVTNHPLIIKTNNTERIRVTAGGVTNHTSRINANGATDNSIFAINTLGCINSNALSFTGSTVSTNQNLSTNTVFVFNGGAGVTWTLENPSGNNRIVYVKNAGSGILTVNAYAGTNIINNVAASVSSITVTIGATAILWQDGNVKTYQLQ